MNKEMIEKYGVEQINEIGKVVAYADYNDSN